MIRKLLTPSLILISLSFSGCETDFDVTAPYKEIPVVYGLLDVSDTIQWVRINKAYLGDGDAYVMAQNADSINYPDILDVSLEEYDGNKLLRTLILTRDESVPKEPGVFATTPNVLYRTNMGDTLLEENSYKLVIHNQETDSITTATTEIVDNFSIITPIDDPDNFDIDWVAQFPVRVKWQTTDEGVIYQLTIRFNYNEVKINDTVPVYKYEDWTFPEFTTSQNGSQQADISIDIPGESFYHFIATSISADNSVTRHFLSLDFKVTCGGEEFYTYMVVNQPPTGINQNLVEYTNINGGIGIFSSRVTTEVKDKDMTDGSKEKLKNGSVTGHLGFE